VNATIVVVGTIAVVAISTDVMEVMKADPKAVEETVTKTINAI
jgi:aspartokinase